MLPCFMMVSLGVGANLLFQRKGHPSTFSNWGINTDDTETLPTNFITN